MEKESKSPKRRARQIRIETDPTITPLTSLEVHHVQQLHLGGPTTFSNLIPLTLDEHCLVHKLEGELSSDPKEKAANFWAVNAILRRMTKDEFLEFQRKCSVIGRRKSRRSN